MLCHNFHCTYVRTYTCTDGRTYVPWYVYVRTGGTMVRTMVYVYQRHDGTIGTLASTLVRTLVPWYFIPFILETGGRVNNAARDWLDALTAPDPGEQVPSQDDHPWNPQTRTTTETVLREAMQALLVRRWCASGPCLRGLWWRSALQTSLSSWNLNCSRPWCLLCWQRPLAS